MAFLHSGQARQASFADLMNGTLAELRLIRRELAIYFAIVAVLAFGAGGGSDFGWALQLAALAGYFAGQFWLYRAMLRRTEPAPDAAMRVLGLAIMALLLIIPITIASNFLLIPGIILAAKWVMAPTFLVAKPGNAIDAIGASWRASDGNTLNLALAFSALVAGWTLLYAIGSAVTAAAFVGVPTAVTWVFIHILPVLLMGLSVTAYRLLAEDEDALGEVFA